MEDSKSGFDREATEEERRFILALEEGIPGHSAGIMAGLLAAARHPEWWAYWAPIVAGLPDLPRGGAERIIVNLLPVEVAQ